jgi:hypothetical protein
MKATLMSFELDIASIMRLQVVQHLGKQVLQVLERAVVTRLVADELFETDVE